MKKNSVHVLVHTLMLLTVSLSHSSGQIVLTGTDYTQTFDNLAQGLPPGWSLRTNATATTAGIGVAVVTNTTSWGNTSGQFANFASTSNNGTNLLGSESVAVQAACTNRCLGMRQTGSFGDPGAAFVLQLQNTLGFANFQLIIDLNMLSVQGRSNAWTIDYGIGASPVSFIPVWTNADPQVFGTTTRTVAFNNALDNQGLPVWIRIVALETTAGTGSRDTFGIDNFKLHYQSSSAASPIPLQIQLIGTNAVLTWSNSNFALQAAPQATGTYTSLTGATSPYTNPASGSQRYYRLKAN